MGARTNGPHHGDTRMWLSVQGIVAEKLLGLWSSLYPGMLVMIAACTAITAVLQPGVQSRQGLVAQPRASRRRLLLGHAAVPRAVSAHGAADRDRHARDGVRQSGGDRRLHPQRARPGRPALSFWWQVAFYLLASDFLLYWSHRIFHGASLWRYHAIHHSAEDVDWTTAYRFHPVNICFGTYLADVIMLYAGVSPEALMFMVPLQTAMALFVHANLNWTLGPLKYVLATPVFHRWHHTMPDEGGNRNFASDVRVLGRAVRDLLHAAWPAARALRRRRSAVSRRLPRAAGLSVHRSRRARRASARSARCHPGSDLLDRSANPDRQQLPAALGRGGRADRRARRSAAARAVARARARDRRPPDAPPSAPTCR